MLTIRLARFRRFTLATLLCTLLGAASASADSKIPIAFDIAAQDLAAALNAFALQSGRDVMFAPELAAKLKSAGVHGKLDVLTALKTLLTGTGLEYEVTPTAAIVVRKPHETAARINLTQAPAAEDPSVSAAGEMQPVAGEDAVISGHVTDAASGSNLPGALVRLVDTGETTRTDALGYFHFRGLARQRYTLSISYLGYADKLWPASASADAQLQEYPLSAGESDVAQITVFGNRSARALALNQQRTAENSSDVTSADMLGNFSGTTISEALRHMSGVTFARDPVTGDGTNVIIRGMAPDMNAVKLNGLILPVANGLDRSADLSNILADSISKVTINKTLLPSQDSAGTGGLVEIETKSPLDRPRRFMGFNLEKARKGGEFGEDLLASGTFSGTFGSEGKLGLSASAQYRERSAMNVGYTVDLTYGQYLPLQVDGSDSLQGLDDVDPRLRFPFDPGAAGVYPNQITSNFTDVDSSELATTVSGAWRIGEHTSLKLDLLRFANKSQSFTRNAYVLLYPSYVELPVAALDGELRQSAAWLGNTYASQQYHVSNDVETVTSSYSLGGSTSRGNLDLRYTLGYSDGTNRFPDDFQFGLSLNQLGAMLDPGMVQPGAIDPVEGRIITPFGPRNGRGYPLPLLTDAGFAFYNDPASYSMANTIAVRSERSGSNSRRTANLGARYGFDKTALRYLEAGVNFESSVARSFGQNLSMTPNCTRVSPFQVVCPSLGTLGLQFQESSLAAVGITGRGFNVISRDGLEQFLAALPGLTTADGRPVFEEHPSPLDPRLRRNLSQEDGLASYLQARVDIGKLEITGGVRANRVDVQAINLMNPHFTDANGQPDPDFEAQFAQLRNERAVTTDILPRVLMNYRQTDNLIFRGGYFLSVARPSLYQISSASSISLDLQPIHGPAFDQPELTVSKGNPALEPAVTHNFDLGVEYYDNHVGVMKLSGFYKQTHNLLEYNEQKGVDVLDGVTLPDHPYFQDLPDNLLITGSIPRNSDEAAHLWGIEAGVERQFTFLPGFWSGFGMFVNYTYTASSRRRLYTWSSSPVYQDGVVVGTERVNIDLPDSAYAQQSARSGTASLTYSKYGLDGSLAYSYQARALSGFVPRGLSLFTEEVGTLDLHLGLRFDRGVGHYSVFFEGADLLKNPHDSDLETTTGGVGGLPKYYTGAGFIGGRQFKLGVSASF